MSCPYGPRNPCTKSPEYNRFFVRGRVAQLDRAPASEAGGRGFEPRLVQHKRQIVTFFGRDILPFF